MTVGNSHGSWGRLIPIFGVSGFFLLSLISLILINQPAMAVSSPAIINYQGKLLIDNKPATTTQSMTFVLYDSASGGTALYTASGTTSTPAAISVLPSVGLFSIDLGGAGTNALDTEIFNTTNTIYIEVTIATSTLSPRKRITAVPYSYTADFLRGVAPSTNTNTTYIPVSDASGNFNFNLVTSTGIYSSGNITASGSVRSRMYCDINGDNCFVPETDVPAKAVTNTAIAYKGDFGNYALAHGKQGYEAGNEICSSTYAGYHFCYTGEVVSIIRTQGASSFGSFGTSGWIANGPPGYTASSNDCAGHTESSTSMLGAWWEFSSSGGGMGKLVSCGTAISIACCK